MPERINKPICISTIFNGKTGKNTISKVLVGNKVYKIEKQGFVHTYKKGNTLFYVFSVSSQTISFKILLDTSSLTWKLEEIYDENIG